MPPKKSNLGHRTRRAAANVRYHSKLSEEERALKREQSRLKMHETLANETPERREERLKKVRIRAQEYRKRAKTLLRLQERERERKRIAEQEEKEKELRAQPSSDREHFGVNFNSATMSTVEKVATNVTFSTSSPIGQTNRKPNHLLPRVAPNSSPTESNLDGKSEFEEALKNIKALNGQSRYSDDNDAEEESATSSSLPSAAVTEKSATNKNVFDIKLEGPEKPDSLSSSSAVTSNVAVKAESQFSAESVSKLKSDLGSFFSKSYSDSIGLDKQKNVFGEEDEEEDADSGTNEVSCDKADSEKDKREKERGKHSNHSNSSSSAAFENSSHGNGHPSKIESTLPEEKLRDSLKSFLQKSSNSFSKMSLKKKEETNAQSVTSSTSDSESSSSSKLPLAKTSLVRGNLFEKFESIASPESEGKDDEDSSTTKDRPKPEEEGETTDGTTKRNGQTESKLSSSLKLGKTNSDPKEDSDTTKDKALLSDSKAVNNFCDKDSKLPAHHKSSEEGTKPNNKSSSSLHSDKSASLSSTLSSSSSSLTSDAKDSQANAEKLSKDASDNLENNNNNNNNNAKKRPAELDGGIHNNNNNNNGDFKDEEAAPVKRSRLDDMIGNLGSRIGIKLDSIPFVDELEEELSKDSDSSEKPSEDTGSTDDEEDGEKPLGQKIIKMTEKELCEIVKREVEKILNSKETNLQTLQQKIDELQAANENWKIRAKELHKQVLEQTLILQKSEKRKINSAIAKSHSTRHVGIQVEETKILPANTTQPCRSGPLISTPIASTPPVSKFQSPTVKSLLDASRNSTTLNQVSSSVVYQSSPGLFVVSSPVTTTSTTTTAHSILNKSAPTHLPTTQAIPRVSGTVKVIDLTGDDENSLSNQANSKNLVHTAAMAPIGQVRPSLVPQQVVRQVAPVQQQPVPPGTSFLLSTPAGTQIISSAVTQGIAGARPGVCQYVLTSTPNIRPGSLVTVVTTQGQNTSIRPPIVSSTIASGSSLPQLRPALPSSSVASVDLTKGIRPPPPLQSAPLSQRVVSTILSSSSSQSLNSISKHPAPLPPTPSHNIQAQGLKNPPPKPGLRITRVAQGIVLSWNMTLAETHAEISNYQLYAYQEGSASPSTSLWKKVGDIKALPLPMACTLTQFHEGNKYHFAVRAVDTHGRVGPFSEPNTINLSVGGK